MCLATLHAITFFVNLSFLVFLLAGAFLAATTAITSDSKQAVQPAPSLYNAVQYR